MTTNDVVVATSAADSAAVDDVRSRYAELLGRQAALGAAVFAAVGTAGPAFDDAHRAVQAFVDQVVRPQLRAAVELIYPASADVERSRLLVEGLLGETQLIEQAAARIARDADRVQIAAHVESLRVLLEALLGKVADLLLPALAEASGVSLADLAAQLPAIPSEIAQSSQPGPAAHGHGHGHGGCGCGEEDEEMPELDVREIPHAIRHATVFGAFDAVPVGGSMLLVAPHDPIPLLHQLAERSGGRLAVGYEQRGPEAWRLRLTRV
ncbi:hypothetical protein MTER_23760 [Mycolicibacter terrae]|jgi:uncharacterized protein (DUF2249 family)|uniref:DUF2249 domain-containing protein n=1 Tax=Mycolicibacter terrae TaxID=1788 RepID=A0AAD1HYM3_9MYCO|nr:DUF2249 domain-containing protein [Mycolicibacter terrae]ORW88245.1 hemerythrin HHE cation-binding protein [Mycolicibacter terrae]BBX22965.1 hypothetical protein MTER_23760 [Mycolicibacter terrae]SNV69513.1 hemerythrin HHE cation binding domain-containing protein [Mycolicibacter terrae]